MAGIQVARSRSALVLVLALAAMSVPAFFVHPAGDDWGTIRPRSTPFEFGFLQGGIFFRPPHQLLLGLGATLPSAYEALLHAATVLGHWVSAAFLFVLALRYVRREVALAAAVLFALHPGAAAAVWSLDSATQTWSTAFGLAAVWMSSRAGRLAWLWPVCALLAALCKESGVAWFVVVLAWWALREHLLGDVQRRERRARTSALAVVGGVGLCVYAGLRLLSTAEAGLGAEQGRYSLQLDGLTWSWHLAQLLGASLTSVDTVALFGEPRILVWVVLSTLLSMPLLGLLVLALYRRGVVAAMMAFGVLGLVALPHLPIQHVSEMYVHPIVAMAVLVGSLALAERTPSATASNPLTPFGTDETLFRVCLALAFFGVVGVSAHKASRMIATGNGARAVGRQVASAFHGARPEALCAVPHPASVKRGYSAFDLPRGRASGWGAAVLAEWQWRAPKRFVLAADAASCWRERPDAVILFTGAATFEVQTAPDGVVIGADR